MLKRKQLTCFLYKSQGVSTYGRYDITNASADV